VSMENVLESGYWQKVLCRGVRLGGVDSGMPIGADVGVSAG
jgi:hypothetical protein